MASKTYGDVRNYRKIDIFINGRYEATTTWSRTCKAARERIMTSGYTNVECRYGETQDQARQHNRRP